jgi:voltage-gated potassium channel Kch
MAACVVTHATGVTAAMRWEVRKSALVQGLWMTTRLFIVLAGWIIFLHLVEITVWAAFYLWKDAMPDLQTALYFSAVTYTTTGYGDIVLPQQWRLVGAVEALTGILMCGWSTGFFFVVVSRTFETGATTRRRGA